MEHNVTLLDHGYLKLVESWGSDERIIESARMSTNKGFQGWGGYVCVWCGQPFESQNPLICSCGSNSFETKVGDEKLLRFLYEHKHMTPFEMAGCIIEVQAPIFVFREWHRHRTQSFNELSARYTELPDLYYVPNLERFQAGKQNNKNKQGSESGFDTETAELFAESFTDHYSYCRRLYDKFIAAGMARELARIVIPVGQYSRMRASANLRNWLAFLTLRNDPAAQYEIRVYAQALADIISKLFPRTYELFKEEHEQTRS